MKRRAETQEETRRRIVEAAVALHEAVGGPATTVSAIAERAGVGRVTVYRHFPDERALLSACTGHYFATNPPPDPAAWADVADPEMGLRAALGAHYGYYRRTEGMLARAEQDALTNPVLAELLAPHAARQAAVRDALVRAWVGVGAADADAAAAPELRAAVGHALAFGTWRSLVREEGLGDEQAVALMLALVRCTASARRSGGDRRAHVLSN